LYRVSPCGETIKWSEIIEYSPEWQYSLHSKYQINGEYGCQKPDSGCNCDEPGLNKLPQNSIKNCGPFCGPSSVHSRPLAPLRTSDKNPETRTIKQNQLTSLIENVCPGDSRRLHHSFNKAQSIIGALFRVFSWISGTLICLFAGGEFDFHSSCDDTTGNSEGWLKCQLYTLFGRFSPQEYPLGRGPPD